MNDQCPKLTKCPIFVNNVLHDEFVGETYKNLYCLASEDKYSTCKRYVFSETYGIPAPDNVMPNTFLSIEEIAKRSGIMN